MTGGDVADQVPEIYQTYAPKVRSDLLALRDLILEVAQETAGVGTIEETLKWGQPSFVTVRPKSGSTLRIDKVKDSTDYAIYFICHTHLVARFRELYPNDFTFAGDRALIFKQGSALPVQALKHCIAMALTYHLK